jgi:hypothetical protein
MPDASRDCLEGCAGDHTHKWEITPHPQTDDADVLIVDDDEEALQFFLNAAEQAWNDCEPGETRTITIRHNVVVTPGEPDGQ